MKKRLGLGPLLVFWIIPTSHRAHAHVSDGTIEGFVLESGELSRVHKTSFHVPAAWKTEPNKLAQKDCDARWTKKHGRSYFGYKTHINVDARYKLIRRYGVSDASVHDSREFNCLLDKTNTSRNVFADSAYRSADIEAALRVQGLKSRIHRRATRSHPLSAVQEKANRKRSQVRARIEHVFGAQQTALGGRLVRTIGLMRAKAKIGLQNLVYNIRRMIAIERNAAAA